MYRQPDDYDEPETEQEREYSESACAHCAELLAQEHSIMDVIEHHACLLDGKVSQARFCWEMMREKVMA
jgi:hypothetical protein